MLAVSLFEMYTLSKRVRGRVKRERVREGCSEISQVGWATLGVGCGRILFFFILEQFCKTTTAIHIENFLRHVLFSDLDLRINTLLEKLKKSAHFIILKQTKSFLQNCAPLLTVIAKIDKVPRPKVLIVIYGIGNCVSFKRDMRNLLSRAWTAEFLHLTFIYVHPEP